MKLSSTLHDAWYFYTRNLAKIALLCLPLIVLEAFLIDQTDKWGLSDDLVIVTSLAIKLVIYPLYTVPLILFLDARSNGQNPDAASLFKAGLPYWPACVLLTGLSTTAIILASSLFLLPGLWLTVKVAFAEYFLVLKRQTPMQSLHESFALTKGHFWPILGCVLLVMLPMWGLEIWAQRTPAIAEDALNGLLFNSINHFLQLFSSVVLFRMFMLLSPRKPTNS